MRVPSCVATAAATSPTPRSPSCATRAHGYPVPEVIDVRGTDMVMERVDGPTMQTQLRSPWRLLANEHLLAELHAALHRFTAPDGVRVVGPGDTLVHLDLHPANVILSPRGPVVIDWANATSGHWADDVADLVVVGRSATMPRRERVVADLFLRVFLARFDRTQVREHLPLAIERRTRDPNMTSAERERMARVRV